MSNSFTKEDLRRLGLVEGKDGVWKKDTGKKEEPAQIATESRCDEIIINMEPRPCPRPRVSGKQAYMPSWYTTYKKALSIAISDKLNNTLSIQYNKIECFFYFEFPKSFNRAKRIEGTPKVTKPDGDNLLKTVCDAIELAGLIKNDSQFYHMSTSKFYTNNNSYIKIKLYS